MAYILTIIWICSLSLSVCVQLCVYACMCNCSHVGTAFPLLPFLIGSCVFATLFCFYLQKDQNQTKKSIALTTVEVPQQFSILWTWGLTSVSKVSTSTQILGFDTDLDKGFKGETFLCNRKRSKRNTAAFKVPHGRDGFLCHFHLSSPHFSHQKRR